MDDSNPFTQILQVAESMRVAIDSTMGEFERVIRQPMQPAARLALIRQARATLEPVRQAFDSMLQPVLEADARLAALECRSTSGDDLRRTCH